MAYELITNLKGPKGDDGEQGARGEEGPPGPTGPEPTNERLSALMIPVIDQRIDELGWTPGGGGGGAVEAIDDGQALKLVAYANGSLRAIPLDAGPASAPGAPSATPGSTAISVSWTIPPGATEVALWRSGQLIYRGNQGRYRDVNVTEGVTYDYVLIAYTQYGWRSEPGPASSAAANAALNVPPNVTVTTWPAPLPAAGKGLIRVAGWDPEAQQLEYALSVTSGTVTPTQDPSIWHYEA